MKKIGKEDMTWEEKDETKLIYSINVNATNEGPKNKLYTNNQSF